MEDMHIFPSFHHTDSDPEILVFRGYPMSGGFMTTQLCIFILVINDMSM